MFIKVVFNGVNSSLFIIRAIVPSCYRAFVPLWFRAIVPSYFLAFVPSWFSKHTQLFKN